MQQAPASRENAPDVASFRTFRPRTFNRRTQVRFLAVRTAYWLSRCPAERSPRQETLAEAIAQLEWAAEVARRENSLTSLRDLREHLRLRDRLVSDLERSVREAAEAAASNEAPGDALNRHLAMLAERHAVDEGEDEAA